jgi:hypothetical protein
MPETSAQFLKSLHRGLKWRVTPDEAKDIVRDYREFFEEEQKSGKTEAQISEALGSPHRVITAIMEERPKMFRHRLYWPCLVLAVVAALFFPIMQLVPFFSSRVWMFAQHPVIPFIFVLLAPLPALLCYSLQHERARVRSNRPLYVTAGLSLLLFGVVSASMYMFLKGLYINIEDWQYNLFRTYDPLLATIMFVSFVWVLGIFLSAKSGRYVQALYFLYAAIQVSLNHFCNILGSLNFEEMGIPFEHLAFETFFPLVWIILCAAFGAALWCGLQWFLGKRGGE